jgi:hypothetical protein
VVALLRDCPERSLVRGQAGTVVELLSPTAAEVEFSDDEGRTCHGHIARRGVAPLQTLIKTR